jgi:large subunit ribosomal protein L10
MAISRLKKEKIVKEIGDLLKDARVVFLVDFIGVKTAKINILRQSLKKLDANYKVIKKTLAELAFKGTDLNFSSFLDHSGSLALISANENEVEISKAIAEFKKENESLAVVGGFLGKEFLSKERISFLAKIPSREVLLTQLAIMLASPMQGLVLVLNSNLQKFVLTLKAIERSK